MDWSVEEKWNQLRTILGDEADHLTRKAAEVEGEAFATPFEKRAATLARANVLQGKAAYAAIVLAHMDDLDRTNGPIA